MIQGDYQHSKLVTRTKVTGIMLKDKAFVALTQAGPYVYMPASLLLNIEFKSEIEVNSNVPFQVLDWKKPFTQRNNVISRNAYKSYFIEKLIFPAQSMLGCLTTRLCICCIYCLQKIYVIGKLNTL